MQAIERQFARIGARAKIHPPVPIRSRQWRRQPATTAFSVNIGQDRDGEFFDITLDEKNGVATQVVDVQPDLRHLLLMSSQDDGKHKFLCGHDERHWFVAAVPEREAVASVQGAFRALKPKVVHALEDRLRVKPSKRNRRRNEAFVRQGEWFFIPVQADLSINERMILHDEPISRGRGKPHRCEEVFRHGGEQVYVNQTYPQGLTDAERQRLFARKPRMREVAWTVMRRNPRVYARGRVRHTDHKTIVLDGWHEVIMNTENESLAMRHVAFLD